MGAARSRRPNGPHSDKRPLIRRHADDVTLWIGKDAERHARNFLRRLDRPPSKLLRVCKSRRDVFDSDEEQHRVVAALQRADRSRQRSVDAGVDKGVAGERTSE